MDIENLNQWNSEAKNGLAYFLMRLSNGEDEYFGKDKADPFMDLFYLGPRL